MELRTAYLADHPEALPVLAAWFEAEWPSWYGPGGRGNAKQDLSSCSARDALPVGVVGFLGDKLVGVAILKRESVSGRPDLSPWAGGGLVLAPYRRRGMGAKLLLALEDVARRMGFQALYCGTATSESLLERCGWTYLAHSDAHGEAVAVYRRTLGYEAPLDERIGGQDEAPGDGT
jgi:GNAT superfamily N-acetyltransferase